MKKLLALLLTFCLLLGCCAAFAEEAAAPALEKTLLSCSPVTCIAALIRDGVMPAFMR